jgi:hypothetical protein
MKNIRFKFIGVLLLMVLVLGSCKKWIDTSMNVNPDAPSDIPMSSLVPAIEANMAYNLIGSNDYSRVTSEWMQYYQGVGRQSLGEANYTWHDGDVDNVWNTAYSGIMMDLTILTTKARTANDKTYLGIADVLMAESLAYVTDVWGNVPYSEAFQGVSNLNPIFDQQMNLYPKILSMLDEAIASLSDANAVVVSGDLIYGGDPTFWLKAAHGMKARYLLHTSKLDNSVFAKALTEINSALVSNADDMQFAFSTNGGQQNPLFQFMQQRAGDMTMHETFMDMLNLRKDPRIPAYAKAGTGVNPYQGAGWGSAGDSASTPGSAVAAGDAPVLFLTYAECLFIKAECEYKANSADPHVKDDIINGLTASLNKWGVFSAPYVLGYTAYLDTVNVTLYKELMTQKYIALYNQAETFNDWRRTNNLIGLIANPTSAAVQNVIPRRFPYSLAEKSYNTNTPMNVTIWDRVWWDTAKK